MLTMEVWAFALGEFSLLLLLFFLFDISELNGKGVERGTRRTFLLVYSLVKCLLQYEL